MARKTRTGSVMSSKQLARTVVDGKKVFFHLPSYGTVEGYLCGMDDFHWMVISPDGETQLIHKGSASIIHFADHPTYSDEPIRDELERVVAPFRRFVQAEFFGRATAPARDTERATA